MSPLEQAARARLHRLPAADAPMACQVLPELRQLGMEDLSLARLLEPQLDAVRILAEAGVAAAAGALYGVWASETSAPVRVSRTGDTVALNGTKYFCGGAGICDRALVTAVDTGGHALLVDVDLREGRQQGSITTDPASWTAPAFAETATWTVTFHDHVVPAGSLIGPPGFYLDRPGFWIGALGPVAVWVGGAAALVAAAEDMPPRDAHQRAELGEMRALRWSSDAQLTAAGREADESPRDTDTARRRALMMRHLVERASMRVVELFGRYAGPRALAFDQGIGQRLQELILYVRQVHSAQELDELGLDARCGHDESGDRSDREVRPS